MKKLLIIVTCFASLGLAACSRLVHKIDIQQGNVVTREEVSQLEPGMTRGQVRFIMGSPMLANVFHQDRWDYVYSNQPGHGELSEDHVTLHFKEDALTQIAGTVRPVELIDVLEMQPKQTTVVVPPFKREEPGVLNKLWHWITFRDAEEQ